MIANVTLGNGFAGLLAYLLRGKRGDAPERVEWSTTRNLPFDDPALIPSLMRATAAQSRRVETPVYHLSISLDHGESLDRERFEEVVDRMLRDLGLGEHQAVIVSHNDTEHRHVHVMVNRVHPGTGRVWHNGHDYARIEKSLRQQERELGLRHVPGRHFALEGQERFVGGARTLPKGARRAAERTGRPSFTELAREVARPPLRQARSWGELHRRLDALGLGLAKQGRGLVLGNGPQQVKVSLVDRRASLARLEKRLGPWRPPQRDQRPSAERWRDVVLLRRLGSRLADDRAQESTREREERTACHEQQRNERETERRGRQLSARLDGQLAQIYRDPVGARRQLEDRSRDDVGRSVASFLRSPESFGKLRGRGGVFASAERSAALDAVPEAAETLRHLGVLRAATHPTTPGLKPPRRETTTPTQRRARRLDRLARRLVQRLGWKLVASILPPPHLTALRITLDIGRRAFDLLRDRERGRE